MAAVTICSDFGAQKNEVWHCFRCFPIHFPLVFKFLTKCQLSWQLECSSYFIGEGNGTPLQYSCLENPMDGGAWWAAVRGFAEGRTLLSDFTFTFHFHALEKEMATHSSVLAWRVPWTEKPGGLQSMGSHRVGHDWSDLVVVCHILDYACKGYHMIFVFPFPLSYIGEANGNPLQCSCLVNPRDRGAWWASVYGVAQSRTWLKRLSSSSSNYFIMRQTYMHLLEHLKIEPTIIYL